MTNCSLSPIIFVMIFTTQLIREMGLKSFIFVDVLTFGTRVMKELLIAWRSIVPLKKS
jgi:hypothetical protein